MTPVGSFVEITHRYKDGTETTYLGDLLERALARIIDLEDFIRYERHTEIIASPRHRATLLSCTQPERNQ